MERDDFNDLRVGAAGEKPTLVAEPDKADPDFGNTPGDDVASANPLPGTPATESPDDPTVESGPDEESEATEEFERPYDPPGTAMRGQLLMDDYTRKSQANAEHARLAADAQRHWETQLSAVPGLREFVSHLDQNPALAADVAAAWERHTNGAGAPLRPTQATAASPEILEIKDKLEKWERQALGAQVDVALRQVQGRHHLANKDLALVERVACATGLIRPGLAADQIGPMLEAAYRIAFYDKAATNGQKELVRQAKAKPDPSKAQPGVTQAPRSNYSVAGKTLRQVAEDAKAAGSRGL